MYIPFRRRGKSVGNQNTRGASNEPKRTCSGS